MTMYYAIIGEDSPNSLEKRLKARPEHLARLEQLKSEGRLLVAGPFPAIDSADPGSAGFSGSLIVGGFASLAAAKTWADAGPWRVQGVYQHVKVMPFKVTLP